MIIEEQQMQELADARKNLANAILEADNSHEILTNLRHLTTLYNKRFEENAKRAKKSKKKKKKESKHYKKAKFFHSVGLEFYTVLMCAVYNKNEPD